MIVGNCSSVFTADPFLQLELCWWMEKAVVVNLILYKTFSELSPIMHAANIFTTKYNPAHFGQYDFETQPHVCLLILIFIKCPDKVIAQTYL